jgi:hypothetical protein
MTRLYIDIGRTAHDDDEFEVLLQTKSTDKCDNCGRTLDGATILAHFYDRKELMTYLTAKIKDVAEWK